MQVEVDPDDVDTYNTDDRGRIYLGPEHANSEVEVAVLDSEANDGQ
jgi:hypothetical protein